MSPIRTEHDSDPTADFAKYRSFAWISEDPVMGPRPGVAGGEYINDRATRQAVWVGWASKRLSKSDDSEEILGRAVSAILEEFPAPSRS